MVFSLASFAGGIAQPEAWLISARAVQGLGAAMVAPAALSIITVTFSEGAERNRALGIWGAVAGAGGAAGPCRHTRRPAADRPPRPAPGSPRVTGSPRSAAGRWRWW